MPSEKHKFIQKKLIKTQLVTNLDDKVLLLILLLLFRNNRLAVTRSIVNTKRTLAVTNHLVVQRVACDLGMRNIVVKDVRVALRVLVYFAGTDIFKSLEKVGMNLSAVNIANVVSPKIFFRLFLRGD